MSDNTDKIFKGVVNQHECAKRVFKDGYCFETKQKDVLFHIDYALRKHQSEQLADQNRVATLNKKMSKRQILIENLITQLEVSASVTELDVGYARE